jgi:hypothetical protein
MLLSFVDSTIDEFACDGTVVRGHRPAGQLVKCGACRARGRAGSTTAFWVGAT